MKHDFKEEFKFNKNHHTNEISRLIGSNVGSSASKPAATIGIMAVKILFMWAEAKIE